MSKSSKVRQDEKEGYHEGLHTGYIRGYHKGLADALLVVKDLLDDNGVNLADSEFFIHFETMKSEGDIKEPHEYNYI